MQKTSLFQVTQKKSLQVKANQINHKRYFCMQKVPNMDVFGDVTPSSLADTRRFFSGGRCLSHQGHDFMNSTEISCNKALHYSY